MPPAAPTALNRTRSRAALLTTGAAVAALVLSACGSGGTSGGSGNSNFVAGKDGISTVAKGSRVQAPRPLQPTVDGKQLDVKDYKGKVVVLNVWGSWCPPCRAEAPTRQGRQGHRGEGRAVRRHQHP